MACSVVSEGQNAGQIRVGSFHKQNMVVLVRVESDNVKKIIEILNIIIQRK